MAFVSVFKILAFSLILMVTVSCKDLARDNVLDPKNPESYSKTVPLIEAFVNMAHPSPYNRWAVESLNALQNDFAGEVNVVMYHRDLTIDSVVYDDPYNDDLQQSYFLQLQNKYVRLWPEVPRGVPDVYLNGAENRFAGTYEAGSLKKMMEDHIAELIALKNNYLIEPHLQDDGDVVKVKCLVARLGNTKAENLRLRVLFIKQNVQQNLILYSVVKMTWPGILIDRLEAGSYKTINAGQIARQQATGVVLALVSNDEQQVLQSKYVAF